MRFCHFFGWELSVLTTFYALSYAEECTKVMGYFLKIMFTEPPFEKYLLLHTDFSLSESFSPPTLRGYFKVMTDILAFHGRCLHNVAIWRVSVLRSLATLSTND